MNNKKETLLTSDLLKKIRRIQITTSRMVSDVFAGQYHSVFKGQGIEFDEVREYQPGDEVRSIDWNVTARMGHPYVKRFVEERELTVVLVLDVSTSTVFGTRHYLKSQLAAELCSVLAFSAIKNNDKVGFLAFSDKTEKYLPARKGTKHVLRVIREALFYSAEKKECRKTDIAATLRFLSKVLCRRSVVFLISDFQSFEKTGDDFNFKKELMILNKRHDCVAVSLIDPLEEVLPKIGLIRFKDGEEGSSFLVDTSDVFVRSQFEKNSQKNQEALKSLFRKSGVDWIKVHTNVPYVNELMKFFKIREKRYR